MEAAHHEAHCKERYRFLLLSHPHKINQQIHYSCILCFLLMLFQDSPASLGAGFESASADIILLRIPAHPRGAFISIRDKIPPLLLIFPEKRKLPYSYSIKNASTLRKFFPGNIKMNLLKVLGESPRNVLQIKMNCYNILEEFK